MDIYIRYASVGRGDTCDEVWYVAYKQLYFTIKWFFSIKWYEKLVLCQAEKRKECESTRSICKNLQEKLGTNDPIPSIQLI